MKILILGYSDLAKRKIIPAIKKIRHLSFDIASVSTKKQVIGQDLWFDNYENAINESKANIVYISLINSKHYFYAKKVILNNKNLIVDKPITLTKSNTLELLRLSLKKKVLLSEAITFNYHKQFKKLLKILQNNKPVKNIIMRFNIPKPANKNFKNSDKLGGGCLNDMLPYAAEIHRIFLKNRTKIKSVISTFNNKLNTDFSLNSYNKDTEFYGHFSHNSAYENNIIFNSENYSLELKRFCAPPNDINLNLIFKKNNKIYNINIPKDNAFRNFLNEYIENLKHKKINFYHNQIKYNEIFKHKIKNLIKYEKKISK